jgi:hypothetical protein
MTDRTDQLLEVWKTTIDVQKHFNELEMRVRSVAITILAAFLAAAGYTVKEGLSLRVFGGEIPLAVLVFSAASICWSAFYLMDGLWYHRLLRGAVAHGLKVEEALKETLPEIGLTQSIGEASPFLVKGRKIGSKQKMNWFYGSILVLLLGGAVGSYFNQPRDPAPAATTTLSKRAT